MGDFLPTHGGPRFSPVDISGNKTYDSIGSWFDEKKTGAINTGKSLYGGYTDEHILPLAITKAISDQYDFSEDKAYNPYNDMQLLGYQDMMFYFSHSKSKAQTRWLIDHLKEDSEKYQNTPAYIAGRILGGLTDPTSLLVFSKYGRWLVTGSRLKIAGKLGGAIALEEQAKRRLDPARTLKETTFITAGGFVLPTIFGGINPKAKKSFDEFDDIANVMDDIDDISASTTKTGSKEFGNNSVGAAQTANKKIQQEELRLDSIKKTGLGWLGEKLPITPIWRTLTSISEDARRMIENMLEIPLLQNKNFHNIPTSQSIERTIAKKKFNVYSAEKEVEDLYRIYLQRIKKNVPLMNTRLGLNLVKGTDGILSFRQFKQAITLRRMGIKNSKEGTELPEVIKGKDVTQKYVYYMGEEYDKLGIPTFYFERLQKVYDAILKRGWRRATAADKGHKVGDKVKLTPKEKQTIKSNLGKIKEKLEYMKTNGSLAKDYVNRIWLRDQINSRWEEFSAIIRPMILKRNPNLSEKVIDDILESLKSAQPYVRFDRTGESSSMVIARNFRSRELRLDKIDEAILIEKGFIETDIFILQRLYFNAVAPDIEITKLFGDPMASGFRYKKGGSHLAGIQQVKEWYKVRIEKLEKQGKNTDKITKEYKSVIEDLEASRDLLRGTYGLPDDPQRSFSRGVRMAKIYNSMTMLTGFLAAVPDVARIISTSGINRGFRTSWDLFTNGLSTEIMKLSRHQAYLSGEALDMVLGSRAMSMYDLENSFGVFNKFEKGTSSMANVYFTYINLMNPWNTLVKSWAGAVNGTRIIEESINLVNGTITKVNKAKLMNAGINIENAEIIVRQYEKHGLGKGANKVDWNHVKIANTELWDDEARATADIFHSALGKDINITIVTPGKGDVPLWFNTEMGGVVVQFKKFAMAASQRMLLRGMQEGDSNFLGGVLMLLAAGATVDAIRTKAFDRSYSKKPFGDKLVNAFDRSGLGGVYSDINNIIERMGDNKIGLRPMLGAGRPYSSYTQKNFMSGFGLGGPSASQFSTIANIMFDWGKGTHNHYTARNVRRLIPFQNVWYLDSLFDKAEKGLR